LTGLKYVQSLNYGEEKVATYSICSFLGVVLELFTHINKSKKKQKLASTKQTLEVGVAVGGED